MWTCRVDLAQPRLFRWVTPRIRVYVCSSIECVSCTVRYILWPVNTKRKLYHCKCITKLKKVGWALFVVPVDVPVCAVWQRASEVSGRVDHNRSSVCITPSLWGRLASQASSSTARAPSIAAHAESRSSLLVCQRALRTGARLERAGRGGTVSN